MQTVAAVTMVRDDVFFLNAWMRHYGGLFGRENCYIINHGRGADVARVAEGCNVIGIPGDAHKNFEIKRWGLLNSLTGGLRRYYRHVIVGDVDELVIVDPNADQNLLEFLAASPNGQILTPLGLEVIHRVDVEDEPIIDHILGPRCHVRPAPHYSKPCIVAAPTKLSRGGHYSKYEKLHTPSALYLMHLKYCDFAAYSDVMDRRNITTSAVGVEAKKTSIGRHWFADARGEDKAVFDAFSALTPVEGFDFADIRHSMHKSWGPRGETGYYHFKRGNHSTQYVLPERFFGVI